MLAGTPGSVGFVWSLPGAFDNPNTQSFGDGSSPWNEAKYKTEVA